MTELNFEELKKIQVPEERPDIRDQALQSALHEFNHLQEQKRKSIWHRLPTLSLADVLNFFPVRSAATGAFASLVIVMIASTIYLNLPEENEKLRPAPKEEDTQEIKAEKKKALQPRFANEQKRKTRHIAPQNIQRPIPQAVPGSKAREIAPGRVQARGLRVGGNSVANTRADKSPPPQKVFASPLYRQTPLHYCLEQATNCGKTVADNYCRHMGYTKSTAFLANKEPVEKTISIKNNKIFLKQTGENPKSFQSITCFKAPVR